MYSTYDLCNGSSFSLLLAQKYRFVVLSRTFILMLESVKYLQGFRLKYLTSYEVFSPLYGTESQIVAESSYSLVLSSAIRLLCVNRPISEFAIRQGKLFEDLICLGCLSSTLSKLGSRFPELLPNLSLFYPVNFKYVQKPISRLKRETPISSL